MPHTVRFPWTWHNGREGFIKDESITISKGPPIGGDAHEGSGQMRRRAASAPEVEKQEPDPELVTTFLPQALTDSSLFRWARRKSSTLPSAAVLSL